MFLYLTVRRQNVRVKTITINQSWHPTHVYNWNKSDALSMQNVRGTRVNTQQRDVPLYTRSVYSQADTQQMLSSCPSSSYGTTTSRQATGQRFVSGPKLALWQDRAAFTRQSSLEAKNMKSVRWVAGWQRESLRTRREALPQRLTYIAVRTGRGAAEPDLAIKTHSWRLGITRKGRNSSSRGRAYVHHAGELWTCYSALCTAPCGELQRKQFAVSLLR
jgi:hypothetical protein